MIRIDNYKDYLRSDWWRATRWKRMAIDGFCCVICKSKKRLNVHHISYLNLGREDILKDLVTLCEKCHALEHKKIVKKRKKHRKGKKREPFSKKIWGVKKKHKISCVNLHDSSRCRPPREFLKAV